MNLGSIITTLEAADPQQPVPHGFANPHSYRGDYMDLAFEPTADTTVGAMLTAARSALGATFQGWKGGDFLMDADTWCWLSPQGDASCETLSPEALAWMLRSAATVPASVSTDQDGAAATPPPVLTDAGQLRMRVAELEDALTRSDSFAQLGATCFREHHAGQIERAYAVMGGWRFALAIGLGLEGDAPWESIHDRIAELRRLSDAASGPGRADDKPQQDEPALGYTGKGRAWCLICPRPDDENVPLTLQLLAPYEECAGCHREIVEVARAQQPAAVSQAGKEASVCGPATDRCDAETGEPCAKHEIERSHVEGDHSLCRSADCEVLRQS